MNFLRFLIKQPWLWALGLALTCAYAQAQSNFPNRPIKVINPLPPGGALDAMLRRIGQAYNDSTGQPMVIESKPGANSIIAAEACAAANPDGYTICLLSNSALSINPVLFKKLPYRIKSFEPITQVAFATQILVAHKSVPVNSLTELVAYSKNNPGKLNYASFGAGNDNHLTFEWIKKVSGADFTHIPYKGAAPAQMAFSSGEVQLMFLILGNPNLVSQINSGQTRGLAVTGTARNPLVPQVPTLTEAGYPFRIQNWFGLFAPAGTPKEVIDKLAIDLTAVIKSPDLRTQFFLPNGFDPVGSMPADFAAFIASEVANGADMVRMSGVVLE